MGASKYIGRVAGLAVALGVGTAVFTGNGVAWADTDSGSSTGSAANSSSAPGSNGSTDSAAASAADSADSDAGEESGSADSGRYGGVDRPRPIRNLVGALSDSLSSMRSAIESSRQQRVSPAATEDSRRASARNVSPRSAVTAEAVSSTADDIDELADVPEDSVDLADNAAEPAAVPAPVAVAVAALPEAQASASDEGAAAEPAPAADVSDGVAAVASDAVAPLASPNGEPTSPSDSPAAWLLAAAARRDFALEPDEPESATSLAPTATALVTPEAPAQQALGAISNPIVVQPVVPVLDDGVIRGAIDAESTSGLPLKFTLIDGSTKGRGGAQWANTDEGGKVLIDTVNNCREAFCVTGPLVNPASTTSDFTFLPDYSVVQDLGSDQFSMLIAEKTQLETFLGNLPVVGAFVPHIFVSLHQVPILNQLLAPIIGHSVITDVNINVGQILEEVDPLDPEDVPVAFTVKVESFDGTLISTNYFPAAGPNAGQVAPTVLNGPGLATAGNIAPEGPTIAGLVPGIGTITEAGYNYVSWDPRGEFDSGGVLQLDNPFFEGRDVIAIIDYLETQPLVEVDPDGDPLLGMIGGSYGGAIQWVAAGIDPRIDAIVPGITWNSLNLALYPKRGFKTAWADLMALALLTTNADFNTQMYPAMITGNLFGFLSKSAQALLSSSGPTVLVDEIDTPSLIIQGTVDDLFVLEQANINGQALTERPPGEEVPTRMIWYRGGHGLALGADSVNPAQESLSRFLCKSEVT